jgi:hypothetical protein
VIAAKLWWCDGSIGGVVDPELSDVRPLIAGPYDIHDRCEGVVQLRSLCDCCFQNYLAQCFRAIWRSVGAPPQREPDSSGHEYGGYSQADVALH